MKKLGTILLIDDDPICSYFNQQLLEEMQIMDSIVCLTDPLEALDYLKRAYASTTEGDIIPPDLIFLDLNMPGLDGFHLLEKINEMGGSKDLRVKRIIILSTSMHPLDQERAGTYNVFDYLVKPLTETKIKRLVDHFLQSQRPGLKIQNQFADPQAVKDRPPLESPAAEGIKKSRETREV